MRGEKGKKNPRTYKNVAEDKKAPAPYGAHIVNKICRMLGFFYLKFSMLMSISFSQDFLKIKVMWGTRLRQNKVRIMNDGACG